MTTNPWKTTPPTEPGLYIASTDRKPGYVRYWTGKHWTAPLHVADLDLTDRIPNAQGGAAQTFANRPIEWLEAVTLDADGFISWGGKLDTCPVAPDLRVEFRMRGAHHSVTGSHHSVTGSPRPARDILRWSHDGNGGDIVAYRVVGGGAPVVAAANEPYVLAASFPGELSGVPVGLDAASGVTPLPLVLPGMLGPAASIGDVTSTAKGSGARYNSGKADLALIPLRLVAASFDAEWFNQTEPQRRAVNALRCLGEFQQTHAKAHLYQALAYLGLENWTHCAKGFTYGLGKYAPWNWSKGMQWSVPLACAARHLVFGILAGEEIDAESNVPHVGLVFCNIVMLLTFIETFAEGNDLPTQWLEAA